MLTKLTNPKKSTHNYINDGLLAFNNLSAAEKEAWKATLPLSPMYYVIPGRYILTVPQGLVRPNVTRILIAIMDVLSQGEGIEVRISLLKLVLFTRCQRSCRIHCWQLQRRMGVSQESNSLHHCAGSVWLVQRRWQMLLQ